MVALLDGTKGIAAVLRARPGKMEVEQTIRVLERLVQAGLVVLRTPGATSTCEPALAFWDACDVDPGGSAARPAASAVGLLAVSEAVETTAAADRKRPTASTTDVLDVPRPATRGVHDLHRPGPRRRLHRAHIRHERQPRTGRLVRRFSPFTRRNRSSTASTLAKISDLEPSQVR
ncbi:hypothetical protein [Amycolatopsis sp. MtRt-6]|uniref:hypothetical protein n=1 Tax=Amycolatopsis sp. MtRt-6 TaxID=2792782 RepID=UPI001A9055D2|nr:hypothetical protein [Amycolatopsis sp. MtRt-6]